MGTEPAYLSDLEKRGVASGRIAGHARAWRRYDRPGGTTPLNRNSNH